MKAYMSSNICDYNQFVQFFQGHNNISPVNVEIIDNICMTSVELKIFLQDFKKDQQWLIPYLTQMSIVIGGIWKCVLITSNELITPIVVYSNMCMYPQYIGMLQ